MTILTEILLSFYMMTLGLIFGSFGAVVGERTVDGESIVRPRSYCIACGRTLRAVELVPIVSWLFLLGKCRSCKADIPMRYPVLELVLGCAFVLSFWYADSTWQAVASFLLWWVLLVAVVTDLKAMIVPNWLTYSSAVGIYIVADVADHSWWIPLLGAVVGYGTVFLIHILSGGKMGLGDAKLYIAIGAFLGPLHCVESFVFAALIGALIGIFLRIIGLVANRQYIPFVPFIAMGVAFTQFLADGLPMWYLHTCLGLS